MNQQDKQQVKRVKTAWGKLLFVGVDDLKDSKEPRLLVRNQYGFPVKVKQTSGLFQLAPKCVYRENLVLH